MDIAVVGGSLGGLTAACLLADAGHAVEIYERSPTELEERGAGIGFLPETSRYLVEHAGISLDAVAVSTSHIRYLGRDGSVVHDDEHRYLFSSWNTVYREMLACFDRSKYRLAHELVDVDLEPLTLGFSNGLVVRPGSRHLRRRCRFDGTSDVAARCGPAVRRLCRLARSGARDRVDRRNPSCARRRDHVLRLCQQPHPRLPDPRSRRVGGSRRAADQHRLVPQLPRRRRSRRSAGRRARHPSRGVGSARCAAGRAHRRGTRGRGGTSSRADRRSGRDRLPTCSCRSSSISMYRVWPSGAPAYSATPPSSPDPMPPQAPPRRPRMHGPCAMHWPPIPTTRRPRWLPGSRASSTLGRNLLARTRAIGRRSQFDGTWRAGDPELIFGLHGPGE